MELLHVRRVAQLLDVTRKRVYALIQEGRLEAVRLGPHQTRVTRDSLDAYVAALRREARANRPIAPSSSRHRPPA